MNPLLLLAYAVYVGVFAVGLPAIVVVFNEFLIRSIFAIAYPCVLLKTNTRSV